MNQYTDETIWIVGASNGIGEALAKFYNELGVNLIISARNHQKLNTIRTTLKKCQVIPLDIGDLQSIKNACIQLENQGIKPNRIIVMAAIYEPTKIENMPLEKMAQTIQINLIGTIQFVHQIIPLLKKQKKSQIALCGSVAGYIGLPKGQPYSATKAGIINFAESLKAELNNTPIDVKLINPGFVKTQLTDKNKFDMPFIIDPEVAAKHIAKGLESRQFEIHFPKKFTLIMKIIRMLPYTLALNIIKKLN